MLYFGLWSYKQQISDILTKLSKKRTKNLTTLLTGTEGAMVNMKGKLGPHNVWGQKQSMQLLPHSVQLLPHSVKYNCNHTVFKYSCYHTVQTGNSDML